MQNDDYEAGYTYNADGLRVSSNVTKDGDTTFTQFLYEGGQLVLELDESGVQTAFNVFGGESIISRMTAQVRVYYLYDGYGNVVEVYRK